MPYDPRFNDGDGLHGGLPLLSTTVGKQTHFLGVVHNPTLIFQFPIYLEPFAPRQPPTKQVTIDSPPGEPNRELEDEGQLLIYFRPFRGAIITFFLLLVFGAHLGSWLPKDETPLRSSQNCSKIPSQPFPSNSVKVNSGTFFFHPFFPPCWEVTSMDFSASNVKGGMGRKPGSSEIVCKICAEIHPKNLPIWAEIVHI